MWLAISTSSFSPPPNFKQMQREWIEGLALLEKLSVQKHGHSLSELSMEQQIALLTEMSLPEHDREATHDGFDFLLAGERNDRGRLLHLEDRIA
jgi:hypothetical protein